MWVNVHFYFLNIAFQARNTPVSAAAQTIHNGCRFIVHILHCVSSAILHQDECSQGSLQPSEPLDPPAATLGAFFLIHISLNSQMK